MAIEIKLDLQKLQEIEDAVVRAAIKTVDALNGEVVSAKVMPFDQGNMQNGGTYASGFSVKGNQVEVLDNEDGKICVALTNDAPQARRLYYNPQYNFQTVNNPNAGGKWLEPWLTGNEKDFVPETFVENLKKEAGL